MEGFTSPGTNNHQQGIKIANMVKGVSHTNHSSVMIAPTGSNNLLEEDSGESVIPPGFEGINAVEGRSTCKGKSQKGRLVIAERRVTRSQAKVRKEASAFIQNSLNKSKPVIGDKEGSPRDSGDTNNSDSITKLVRESFEVGEMLGVRVIGNKDEVIKNFAERLRSERKSGQHHPKPN